MLKLSNVRMPVGADEALLPDACAARLGTRRDEFHSFRILRKALDIRNKANLEFVYTLAVGVDDEAAFASLPNVAVQSDATFEWPEPGKEPLAHRPLIVGAGPAGLFAAWFLARDGYAPIVLERGRAVRERIGDVRAFDSGGPLDPESNYLFGEGGAGTFSDGKLTCRNSGSDTDKVLEIFAASKGKPSIVYDAKPHLGSNRLPAVVKALRQQILAWGGDIQFQHRLIDLRIDGSAGRIVSATTNRGPIAADCVILAIGHSARDTYRMLLERGIRIEPKPFQMGVRIEQPQASVNLTQFGGSPEAKLLGPADYTLNVAVGKSELFTFCMCAGGYIMPSVSEHGHFCTNGMSRSGHDSPYANSGLVTTVDPRELPGFRPDQPLHGIAFQAAIEARAFEVGEKRYNVPIQRANDFLARKRTVAAPVCSYARGSVAANLWELLPADIAMTIERCLPLMDQRWRGKFLDDANLVAPETRGSCPVRIVRDPATRQALGIEGLYPIGEGAGYAGGIVSAAVDGLRTARAIVAKHRHF